MSDLKPATGVSAWLIRRAARHAPEVLAQRLEEEWLADLATRASAASRLRLALGCCWATHVITREFAIVPVPAAAGAGAKSLLASSHPRFGFWSRRTTAFGLVAVLHLAVFYAFMVGLSTTFTKVTEDPLQPRILPPAQARELPPLPPPDVRKIPYELPRLDDHFTIPPEDERGATHAEEHHDPTPAVEGPPQQPVPPHVVTQVPGGPGAGFPNPDDFYPPLARRLEEEGLAIVRVCVDAKGHLTGAPTTLASTGSARLDDGALKLARAGSGHYRASTEDGKPVSSCYPLRIRFQIKN